MDYRSIRYINIVKFWLKIVHTEERKYIKCIYSMMLNDLELKPNKQNWASGIDGKASIKQAGILRSLECTGGWQYKQFLRYL